MNDVLLTCTPRNLRCWCSRSTARSSWWFPVGALESSTWSWINRSSRGARQHASPRWAHIDTFYGTNTVGMHFLSLSTSLSPTPLAPGYAYRSDEPDSRDWLAFRVERSRDPELSCQFFCVSSTSKGNRIFGIGLIRVTTNRDTKVAVAD